jgi:NAD(P)-dependent dehydrogenase (short-subunit alcohol dehydrogenase family)
MRGKAAASHSRPKVFQSGQPLPCHIGKREDVENLVAETRKRYGKIDVLVCNAAVNPYYGPMSGLTDDAFTKVIDSNVRSNLWLCNLTIPEMAAERKDGSVIIVSSIGGLKGSQHLGIYAISKAADFQLARNLAVEWGPKKHPGQLYRARARQDRLRSSSL